MAVDYLLIFTPNFKSHLIYVSVGLVTAYLSPIIARPRVVYLTSDCEMHARIGGACAYWGARAAIYPHFYPKL